jgi:hypothetical protein
VTRTVIAISALGLLSAGLVAYSEEKREPSRPDGIVWGKVVDGLQFGISPPVGDDGALKPAFDGDTLRVRVHLRNVGKSPVRLLATVHDCVAMGSNGAAAIHASKLVLTPKAGGDPRTVTYQGWNHLHLLDTRRDKSESWQKTLARRGWKTDIRLTAEDAEYMSTVLDPCGPPRIEHVVCSPIRRGDSPWRLEPGEDPVTAGTYGVTAVLKVDHERSKWKGELVSGSLDIEIRPLDKKKPATPRPSPSGPD